MALRDVRGSGRGEPSDHIFLITASDTADLPFLTRALRVGGAGDLAVRTQDGTVTTIPNLLAGETIDVRAERVYSTNTTATSIMGLA